MLTYIFGFSPIGLWYVRKSLERKMKGKEKSNQEILGVYLSLGANKGSKVYSLCALGRALYSYT